MYHPQACSMEARSAVTHLVCPVRSRPLGLPGSQSPSWSARFAVTLLVCPVRSHPLGLPGPGSPSWSAAEDPYSVSRSTKLWRGRNQCLVRKCRAVGQRLVLPANDGIIWKRSSQYSGLMSIYLQGVCSSFPFYLSEHIWCPCRQPLL